MNKDKLLIYACWLLATISMLGSLFFSEIMQYPPCTLCWYQRIAMYPLVIIFFLGATENTAITFKFSIPFVVIGWVIALYHNLLHYKIIPESASPCMQGVSCATVYIKLAGFLTIPMMSLISFTLLIFLLVIQRKFYAK